jgi:hypothetical protein
MSCGKRDSCHELFRQLYILLLHSQYIFSLRSFIIQIRDQFSIQFEDLRYQYRYNSNLVTFRIFNFISERCFLSRSRIYNHLLSIMKDLSQGGKCLQTALERYSLDNSFYSLEEYFNQNMSWPRFFSTSSFYRCTSSSSLSHICIFHLLSVSLTQKYLIFSSFSSTFSFKCHMMYLSNCHVDRKQ